MDSSIRSKEEMLKRKSRNNKLLRSFLSNSDNYNLIIESLRNPTLSNQRKLDKEFKKFYENIRLIKYVSKLIYYYSLNYDQKVNKRKTRFPLVLDRPLYEGNTTTIAEQVADHPEYYIGESLTDQIENEKLIIAIKKLTKKQLEILELYYLHGMTDIEIKESMSISQQAVNKTRKRALEILRKELQEVD